MPLPRLSPRIAIVQFQPKLGQVQANMAKARELCRGIPPRSVDLICLPEMVFSGYNFESAAVIEPYLETSRTGPTSRFCAELSSRLKCYVVAGYPERLEPFEVERHLTETGTQVVGANAAALYGPDGQWVGAYRKTNLYTTDKTWALPGTGFATFRLAPPLRTVSLGICMDLNAMPPHSWTSEDGPYELADYCLKENTNILVMLNAWLDSGKQPEEEHDIHTLNFWAERLRPLWLESSSPASQDTLVVVCNRGGDENGTTFAGSSAVFHMKQGQGKSGILRAALRREDEDVMVWDSST
ncbi:carbon-nitrogen hydrolase [Mycena maculata]|uniref:Carbon-nitrogen hydrolase n=1 Tax=Mycena maculata TaxID=230809 RepID=A0AAD7HVV7_9AGAR|nr:carbon-nitrogen hydrolase [Mycena maculata]